MLAAPQITVNSGDIQRAVTRLNGIKNGAGRAIAGAMNDVAKTGRTKLARMAVAKVVLPYGRVLKQVRIKRASPGNLSVEIEVNDRGRPGLKAYGARQTTRGVSYRISKTGGRKTIRDAFEGRGRPGRGIGVSAIDQSNRAQRIFKRAGKKRLPLIDIKGPSLNRVIRKNEVDAVIRRAMTIELPPRIDARVNLLIQRSNRG